MPFCAGEEVHEALPGRLQLEYEIGTPSFPSIVFSSTANGVSSEPLPITLMRLRWLKVLAIGGPGRHYRKSRGTNVKSWTAEEGC